MPTDKTYFACYLNSIRLRFSILLALLLHLLAETKAQSPLDYGKSDSISYLSLAELKKAGIDSLFVVNTPAKNGSKADHLTYLDIYDLSKAQSKVRVRHAECSSPNDPNELNELISTASWGNSTYWSLQDGELVQSGMEGYGTLEHFIYVHHDSFTLVEHLIQRAHFSYGGRIFYHPDGRPSYAVCCQFFGEQDSEAEESLQMQDTLDFLYNKEGLFLGRQYRSKKDEAGANPDLNPPPYLGRCYVGKSTMEDFALEQLGFKPRLLLIEIYRLAAFCFVLDTETGLYQPSRPLELESYSIPAD